ncbi:MAG TPA: hypothetical protein VG899_04250 [Mycobacteriales bacterium]|nr:hypothetical protein [Mycobacteriales bacterium]
MARVVVVAAGLLVAAAVLASMHVAARRRPLPPRFVTIVEAASAVLLVVVIGLVGFGAVDVALDVRSAYDHDGLTTAEDALAGVSFPAGLAKTTAPTGCGLVGYACATSALAPAQVLPLVESMIHGHPDQRPCAGGRMHDGLFPVLGKVAGYQAEAFVQRSHAGTAVTILLGQSGSCVD